MEKCHYCWRFRSNDLRHRHRCELLLLGVIGLGQRDDRVDGICLPVYVDVRINVRLQRLALHYLPDACPRRPGCPSSELVLLRTDHNLLLASYLLYEHHSLDNNVRLLRNHLHSNSNKYYRNGSYQRAELQKSSAQNDLILHYYSYPLFYSINNNADSPN